MLISEMEALLKNLDQRVARIEQILPTLATKSELRDEIRGTKVLIGDVRDDVRIVLEHVVPLGNHVGALTGRVETLTGQVETLASQVGTLAGQVGALTSQVGTLTNQMTEVLRRLDPR